MKCVSVSATTQPLASYRPIRATRYGVTIHTGPAMANM
jgi:hypothetical protein